MVFCGVDQAFILRHPTLARAIESEPHRAALELDGSGVQIAPS